MKTYEYIVLDGEGIPIRIFNHKKLAQQFVDLRPEFKIFKVTHDMYEEIGECLF